MKIDLIQGKYVVAVSGGVDSIVLMHLLASQPGMDLVIAHFDHGIRPDSKSDRGFVEQMAKAHGLTFVFEEGKQGPKASEAKAREARYKFLRNVRAKFKAGAILTAHHQDDLVETALINLVRGTHRKGLSSLKDTADIKRPLLKFTKAQIRDYAKQHGLIWREDSTNQDQKYLRNKIRARLAKNITPTGRQELLDLIEKLQKLNYEIELKIANFLQFSREKQNLNKAQFVKLPHEVAKEILAYWLRQNQAKFDKKSLERLVRDIKTLPAGKQVDIDSKHFLKIGKADIILSTR